MDRRPGDGGGRRRRRRGPLSRGARSRSALRGLPAPTPACRRALRLVAVRIRRCCGAARTGSRRRMDRVRSFPPAPRPRPARLVPLTRCAFVHRSSTAHVCRERTSVRATATCVFAADCGSGGRAPTPVSGVVSCARSGCCIPDAAPDAFSAAPARWTREQGHEEWNSEGKSDVPIDSKGCSRGGLDGRPCGDAPPGPADRHGARHRDTAGIRSFRSRRGRPRCGLGQVRVDRRTGKVRDRRRAARLLRSPRATRAPDGGTADGERRSRPGSNGGLRPRTLARSRGRDRDRLGGRNRDDVRGVQRGHHPGLVRHRKRVARRSRRRCSERAGHRGPRLRPRSEPADHPRLRRRPGADPGGRRPHRRPVERVRRPWRRDRPQQRGAHRDSCAGRRRCCTARTRSAGSST